MTVDVERGPCGDIRVQYHVEGPRDALALPTAAKPDRTDGLWKSTCFELFVRDRGSVEYAEFNFSPSFQWAAYAFDRQREGMHQLELSGVPAIETVAAQKQYMLRAAISLPTALRRAPVKIGLSAVIEETDGSISYWALAHPQGAPDFHHPDCFALELAAPLPA